MTGNIVMLLIIVGQCSCNMSDMTNMWGTSRVSLFKGWFTQK